MRSAPSVPIAARPATSWSAHAGSDSPGVTETTTPSTASGTYDDQRPSSTVSRTHPATARMKATLATAIGQRRRVAKSSVSSCASNPHSPQVRPGVPERSCQQRGQRRRPRALSPKSAHQVTPMPAAHTSATSASTTTVRMTSAPTGAL
ncbi:MAG: hypothetical protein ACKOJI_10785 [Phycisphaerales bacterium]